MRAAFAAVARDRAALAAELRARGQDEQAAIIDIAALIAADPALVTPAVAAVRAGADGADAVRQAGEAQAALLAALPDPDLAQRAGDVRQVAQAVADSLTGSSAGPPPAGKFILVRREVEAADLIRLADAGLAGAVTLIAFTETLTDAWSNFQTNRTHVSANFERSPGNGTGLRGSGPGSRLPPGKNGVHQRLPGGGHRICRTCR